MKQLRQKFGPMRKALERGEEFLLMYRSKPLAVVRPYSAQTDAKHLTESTNALEPAKQAHNPNKLPDPKTISFGSKFDANAARPALKSTQPITIKSATEPTNRPSVKPLDKLGLKRAFI